MQNKFFFILFLSLTLCLSNISAQTSKPKTINGGIVNGKAVSLPKPVYPAAAQAVKANGAVNVQVIIDEDGNIASASATSGHPLLRQVAEDAARKSTFTATTLSGQPVRVSGIIVYNFVQDQTNEEKVKALGLGSALLILRNSASNLEKIKEVFGPEGLLDGIADEFPNFSKELAPLASLEKATAENRLKIINGVIDSIKPKLKGSDVWQFEMGENLGEFMTPFFFSISENGFDSTKLNESELRTNLTKVKNLTNSAPPDFPADVLEKFKVFANFDEQKKISSPENMQEIWRKLLEVIETISPESTK